MRETRTVSSLSGSCQTVSQLSLCVITNLILTEVGLWLNIREKDAVLLILY